MKEDKFRSNDKGNQFMADKNQDNELNKQNTSEDMINNENSDNEGQDEWTAILGMHRQIQENRDLLPVLGKFIKYARKTAHLTTYGVAERTQLSQSAISQVENGRLLMSAETLANILTSVNESVVGFEMWQTKQSQKWALEEHHRQWAENFTEAWRETIERETVPAVLFRVLSQSLTESDPYDFESRDNEPLQAFCTAIKAFRIQRSWSAAMLAKRLGIPTGQYKNVEKGIELLPLEVLEQLFEEFHVGDVTWEVGPTQGTTRLVFVNGELKEDETRDALSNETEVITARADTPPVRRAELLDDIARLLGRRSTAQLEALRTFLKEEK